MNEIDRLNETMKRINDKNKRLSIGIFIASVLIIIISAVEIIHNVSK